MMYQVDLKIKGKGGLFPYMIYENSKEKAIETAIKKFYDDFQCYKNKKLVVYGVFCFE